MKGLTLAAIVGFVAGLFVAPEKGEDTRKKAQDAIEKGKEKLKDMKESWTKGKEQN
ncbi:MAG: YtxH domain-containing protein [Candidatus Margulisiibacteriota bacterium]